MTENALQRSAHRDRSTTDASQRRPVIDPGPLPRRDLWLLPLISVLTVLVMLVGTELATRLVWPEVLEDACRVPDPVLGFRHVPDCTARMKAAEGGWFTASYNGCGYRSPTGCGPVAAGTRRIAMIGTSASEGYMVAYPDSLSSRLGADLERQCGFPVDVQNLGGIGWFGHRLTLRMADAVKLHPDAVLLVVTPFDVESGVEDVLTGSPPPDAGQAGAPPGGLQQRVFTAVKGSRAFTVAQHFIFANPALYLPLYLRYGDKADFLRQPFTPAWQRRLGLLDSLVGQLQDQASAARVPFGIVFEPQEAQVALMAGRYPTPAGVQPAALPDAIAGIARAHGVAFLDVSSVLAARPKPETLYYQVLSHLGPEGQVIAAAEVARGLPAAIAGRFAECHG